MLTALITLLVISIVGALIYLATLDGNYEVRRSRLINADINDVFDKLRDFRTWPEWSPWLMHEPDTKLKYSDTPNEEGGSYSWDGKYIGAGKLTHIKFDKPNRIQEKIEFTRPFKSVCDVSFELENKEGKTNVTWIMKGTMPFLFRFMIPRMIDMISKDYDLGLAMLSGRLDPESEHPKLNFAGETTLEAQQCLCKGFEGYLPEMQQAMHKGFPELMEFIQKQDKQPACAPRSVYHKVDIKKMHFVCDMAIPVTDDTDTGTYQVKQLGGGRYFKVELQGAYDFLELAWYSAYAHLHMKKIKPDNNRPSMEVYENNPEEINHSNETITTIYIPIK